MCRDRGRRRADPPSASRRAEFVTCADRVVGGVEEAEARIQAKHEGRCQMRNLRRRLEKLETSIDLGKTYGRWFMEQQAVVEQTAMSKMPAEDLPVLEELLASKHAPSSSELSEQQRIVWRRWQEA